MDDTPKHEFVKQIAAREGMNPKTLILKLRAAGYKKSLRGLHPPEEILYFHNLLTKQSQEKDNKKIKIE